MKDKRNIKKFDKVEKPKPSRKVRLEVYDDGLYVGTIPTDFTWDDKTPVDEETLLDYVRKRFPTRKKKYLSIKII